MSDVGEVAAKPEGMTALKWLRIVLLPALVGALVTSAILFVPAAGWNTNDVTTGMAPGYPDLQPHRYDSSPINTLRFASAAATSLQNWQVVHRDEENSTLTIAIKTAIPVFTDDMTVTVTPIGTNKDSSLVTIRSHSRIGKADFGENARHIRALQAAMDDKLPRLD